MSAPTTHLTIRRWTAAKNAPFAEPVFLMVTENLPTALTNATVVLPHQALEHAERCFAAGAAQVLLADAALLDSAQIGAMAQRFGSGRAGVWLPAKRMEVRWEMDTASNADFKCMVPSVAKPSWEVLKSDLARTGTEAGWWIEQMIQLGAATVLVSADIDDEHDLNICADLVERFGTKLWVSPLSERAHDLAPWIESAKVTQLALPHHPCFDAEAERLMALHRTPELAELAEEWPA